MSRDRRIAALQRQLLETLRGITLQAEIVSQQRCPYRGVRDVCFFQRGCRNQEQRNSERFCSGAHLDFGTS